jgi:hypothetical protein
MSHPECVFCEGVSSDVQKIHGRGGYLVGGHLVVEDIRVYEPVEGNPYHAVDMRVLQASAVEYSAEGEEILSSGTAARLIYLAMDWQTDHWVVREAQVDDPDA